MQVPVQIEVHKDTVFGLFHIADQQLSKPVVLIMCYGMNGNRVEQHRMSVKLGREAEKKNINLMRFDYRNQGISSGTFIETTISSKLDDVEHVVKDIKGYFGDQGVNIYLIGFSDGARIAVDIAYRYQEVCGVILWNPIIRNPYTEEVSGNKEQTHEKFRMDKESRTVYKQLLGVKINTTLAKEMKQDHIYEQLKSIDKPVFYIFGSKDRFTKEVQKKLDQLGIYHPEKDSVHTVDGSSHIFSSTKYEAEVITNTLNWIRNKY